MASGETVQGRTGKASGAGKRNKASLILLFVSAVAGLSISNGCAGLANTSNAATTPQEAVAITPAVLNFSTDGVNQNATQTATITNTGKAAVSVTELSPSSSEFSTSGIHTPLSLAAGESARFQVTYHSSTTGTVSGTLTAVTLHGGHGKVKLNGGSSAPPQLSLSTSSVNYGNVLVHGSSTQAVRLQNAGQSSINISQLQVSGSVFSVNGLTVPATISAGQSVALEATFSPATTGSASGSISITSNAQNSSAAVSLSGTGVAASYTMALSPSTVSFGNINAGSTATQKVTLSNTGNSSVTISQVSASGAGISVGGLSAAATIAPSQSVPLTVTYAPSAPGPVTGSITVTNSDGVNSVAAVTGTAVAGALSVTPTTASFGSVVTGNSSSAQSIQLKNSGTANLTISSATVSGAGFSASGLTFPLTLTPGQSGNLSVSYAPSAAGASNGAISVVSTAPNSPATVALAGTAVAASYTMSLSPASVSFGNVNVGSTATQSVTLSNTGNSSITISQLVPSGSGVSISGLTAGATIAPSQSAALTLSYTPTASGAMTGGLSVTNSQGVNVTDAVTGTGVAATSTFSVTPASLTFGSVTDGTTAMQNFTITNTGNSSVAISGVSITGAGFSILSGSGAVTLAPTKTASVNVQFAPTAAGAATGSVGISSNATGSPASVSLGGTGVAPLSHSVTLSWGASSSTVAGYNLYRSTVNGGSYSKVNASLLATLNYADSSVTGGTTYYYVATAVDSSGTESVYSNQVTATVP